MEKEESVKTAFSAIKSKIQAAPPGSTLDCMIVNTGGKFGRFPFLEIKSENMVASWTAMCLGAMLCSQQAIPIMLENKPEAGGTILFTGATGSLRGGPKFATLAGEKEEEEEEEQRAPRRFITKP